MPVLETKGALSAQGYGLTTAPPSNYIEDVFSTWLYTGNGSTQTITNGIDLASQGGLVWIKRRDSGFLGNNELQNTVAGIGNVLYSNTTDANLALNRITVNSSGFNLLNASANTNASGGTYASWTFRKQPKFFDIVTYTGTGSNRTIAHNLGSVPGCIFVKRTDATANWQVYHRSLANTQYMVLNDTAAVATGATRWNSTTPTSAVFSVGTDTTVNASGGTYVAYLFAHDAGGFGNAGTDNVISCGSFTTDASGNATVTLGYEPQWVMVKPSSTSESWYIVDSMRGLIVNPGLSDNVLVPNTTAAETGRAIIEPTSTGFILAPGGWLPSSATSIYIAIRRGPMKTPTVGTSVYNGIAYTGDGVNNRLLNNQFVTDLIIDTSRSPANIDQCVIDRLRGAKQILITRATSAEQTVGTNFYVNGFDSNNGVFLGGSGGLNGSATTYIQWAFRRAPGFFDEVCYTGTGANRTINHNLGVVPQLMIVKSRNEPYEWAVYSSSLANTQYMVLNSTAAAATGATRWNSTTPTSTVFSVGTDNSVNANGTTYVAYLFATVAGVSKVGSYTGTGATLTVNCGFTSGTRFVLIKRTDLVGDWYVWDSARGIVAGNDPYLLLNSGNAEVTTTDWVDTASSGFELSNSVGNLVNVVGGSYIFLSVA